MPISLYYADYLSGSDSTGTGTSGNPWKTTQHSLNSITRNASFGDQLNIKSSAADILAAALSLTAYGTPTNSAPLILRGYTSTAGDGGIGSLDGNAGGFYILNQTGACVQLLDLKLGNTGSSNIVALGNYSCIENCEISRTTGHGVDNSNGSLMHICRNFFTEIAGYGVSQVKDAAVTHNSFVDGVTNKFTYAIDCEYNTDSFVGWNLIKLTGSGTGIYIDGGFSKTVVHNSIWSNAGTGVGINANNYSAHRILNNLIEGFSGTGGIGLKIGSSAIVFLAGNAVYNCASGLTLSGVAIQNENNVVPLAGSPFTNPSGGDFTPTSYAAGASFGDWSTRFGPTNYRYRGAVQPNPAGGGSTVIVVDDD